MKRTKYYGILTTAILFISLSAQTVFSQTLKDFFNSTETPVIWFGVDFSETKLIDDPASNLSDVRNHFGSINELILAEPRKFSLIKAFDKTSIRPDISFVRDKNEKVDTNQIRSVNQADYARFTKATIDGIIKNSSFGNHKGLGLVFIMESLNKGKKEASMYVTIVDLSGKKVLLTQRFTAKAGGFGFRNYWAASIYNVLKYIGNSKYKKWKADNS